MTWLHEMLGKAGEKLFAVGAVIAAIVAFWWRARQDGKNEMLAEQEQHRREMRDLKRKIDSETDDLAPADLDSQFQRWVRREER